MKSALIASILRLACSGFALVAVTLGSGRTASAAEAVVDLTQFGTYSASGLNFFFREWFIGTQARPSGGDGTSFYGFTFDAYRGPNGTNSVGWDLYDSPTVRRTGGANILNFGSGPEPIQLGAFSSSRLELIDGTWQTTPGDGSSPEFVAWWNAVEQWRHNSTYGLHLAPNPETIQMYGDGWRWSSLDQIELGISTQPPLPHLNTFGFNWPISTEYIQLQGPTEGDAEGDSTSLAFRTNTFYSGVEVFFLWQRTADGDPSTRGSTRFNQMIPVSEDAQRNLTLGLGGLTATYRARLNGSEYTLIGSSAAALPQMQPKFQKWIDAFSVWRRPESGIIIPHRAAMWSLFFNGWKWPEPALTFQAPDCGQPIENLYYYIYGYYPGYYIGRNTVPTDQENWIFVQPPTKFSSSYIFYNWRDGDRWVQGTINTYQPNGDVLAAPFYATHQANIFGRDPAYSDGAWLDVSSKSGPNTIPASLKSSLDTLFAGYRAYLAKYPNGNFGTYLAQGYDCGCPPDTQSVCHLPDKGGNGETDTCKRGSSSITGGSAQSQTSGAVTKGLSLIDNHLLTYRHEAVDYACSSSASGCTSCGAADGGDIGALPALEFERYHRYQDAAWPGSFGPGVFSGYDVRLRLERNVPTVGQVAGVLDPCVRYDIALSDADGDGSYVDQDHQRIASLKLYDANGVMTGSQVNATSAVLVAHNGTRFTFGLINLDTSNVRWGRLLSRSDRNGNAISIAYVFPAVASLADLGGDRQRLWEYAAITDAYGRSASITYRAQPVGGQRVIERIDLPNGTHLTYGYRAVGDALDGLTTVTYPTGNVTTITQAIDMDVAVQARVITFHEAGAETTHRTKTVHLTLPTYTNAEGEVLTQIPNRIRRVYNGAGELSYSNFFGAGPNGETHVYIISQGTLTRYVTKDGATLRSEQAVTWTPDGDPSTFTWELNEAYASNSLAQFTGSTDALGRTTTFQRAHGSGKATRTDYPDGTYDEASYNAFAQPLSQRDRLGRVTTFTYDSAGNLLSRTEAANTPEAGTTSWTYNTKGQPLTMTDPNGQVTRYEYLPNGHLQRIISPADVVGGVDPIQQFAWDAAGRLHSSTDAVNRTTTYVWDDRNRLSERQYADGSTERLTYGTGADVNLLVEETDRNGNRTRMIFDAAGRRIGRIMGYQSPVAVSETCTYIPGTTIESRCVRAGEATVTGFDFRMRPVSSTVYPTANTALTSQTIYDAVQRVQQRIDPYGRATHLVYDINDRVVRTVMETVPGGLGALDPATAPRVLSDNAPYLVLDTVFDAEGQVLAQIDPRGIRSTTAYDARGRVVATVEADAVVDHAGVASPLPEAARTEYQYDAVGNRLAVVLPRSFVRTGTGAWIIGPNGTYVESWTYTRRHLVATHEVAGGVDSYGFPRLERATESWTYAADGRELTHTDFRGNTDAKTWGVCCARLRDVIDQIGTVVSHLQYDFAGNVVSQTDGNGIPTTRTYDARHRVTSETNGAGETTTMVYDDNLIDGVGLDAANPSAVDGLGFGPDADGSAVLVTNPLGQSTLAIHDGLGRRVRVVDANGNVTTTQYDVVAAAPVAGVAAGSLVKTTVIDGEGHASSAYADAAGRTLVAVDALGEAAKAFFDANGNQLLTVDADGVGLTCAFDGRNRKIACVDGVGASQAWFFDEHSNLIRHRDGLGHDTTWIYDARDRKTQETDRIGAITRWTYNPNNALIAQLDADAIQRGETQPTTFWIYDARNLLIEERYRDDVGTDLLTPDDVRSFTYDLGHRPLTRTDQRGIVTQYVHDGANRLRQRRYPDGFDDTFTFDPAGRLTAADSRRYGVTTQRTYDPAGRVTAEVTQTPTVPVIGGALPLRRSYTIRYRYDRANRVTTLIYPDGTEVARGYSARNQLTSVEVNGEAILERSYTSAGRQSTSTLGNGLAESRSYHADGLIATIAVPGVTSFTYTYDAAKRKTSEADAITPASSQTFAYDDLGRLSAWTGNGGTQSWELTPVGDWTATTTNGTRRARTHNAAHEITSLGSQPGFTHDANGNLTFDDKRNQTYGWDPENRLQLAMKASTKVFTFAYDALGRRVQTWTGIKGTTYISAGDQEVYELPAAAVADGADPADERWATKGKPIEAPRGGFLSGNDVVRVNFQPADQPTLDGFLVDSGDAFDARGDGQSYGWLAGHGRYTAVRHRISPSNYDTLIAMQPAATASAGVWEIALPNGSYPVILVCGDAANRDQTNTMQIEGQVVTDPDPYNPTQTGSYPQGDYDGYAVQATVTDGRLTITSAPGALNPKVCFVEIGPAGSAITNQIRNRLAKLMADATQQTAITTPRPSIAKRYYYASYIDEPVAMDSEGSRLFAHANHLYTIEALTNEAGQVVERFDYSAYGDRTVILPGGTTRNASSVDWNWAYTGRRADAAIGLHYFRARYYDPGLGRFIGRDPIGFVDGSNFYADYFSPNGVDPSGQYRFLCIHSNSGASDGALSGHAFLSIRDTQLKQVDTYGNWPDDHPDIRKQKLGNGNGSDIRKNFSNDDIRFYGYVYCECISDEQYETLIRLLAEPTQWGKLSNCASWAGDVFSSASQFNIETDDARLAGAETPSELGETITELNKIFGSGPIHPAAPPGSGIGLVNEPSSINSEASTASGATSGMGASTAYGVTGTSVAVPTATVIVGGSSAAPAVIVVGAVAGSSGASYAASSL